MSVLERDLVVVSGADAWSFLQSLVSQDVEHLDDGEVVRSLLLTPQGKLASSFRLLRRGEEAWLDVEAGYGAPLAAGLTRFLLRVDARVEGRSEGWAMIAVRGTARAPEPPAGGAVVTTDWPEAVGYEVLGPRDALVPLARALDESGIVTSTASAYERARVLAGVPALGRELDESVIPQEAFLDVDHVSFTKGCFLGQELVCRIDTRGHVNRYLRHLRFADDAWEASAGEEVRAGDRVVGAVTSATAGLALGFVRREVEPGAEVTVGTSPAIVDALPGPALAGR